jgi:hexosaminidase
VGAGRLVIDARFTAGLRGADTAGWPKRWRASINVWAREPACLAPLGRADARPRPVEAAAVSLPVRALGEDESYELVVDARQARLTAPTTLGALHGLETLLQLVRQDGGRWVIPAVRIADRPRFPWRGLLIDPSRRWQPMESICATSTAWRRSR